jgi:acetyl esterase/lipase
MPITTVAAALLLAAAVPAADLKTAERIDLEGQPLATAPHTLGGTGDVTRIVKLEKPNLLLKRCPEKTTKGTVLVCPGGGYNILAIEHEGTAVADLLNQAGYDAAVLEYTIACPGAQTKALENALAAIKLVRTKGPELGLNTKKLGIMGFSAGGHLSARSIHELGAKEAPDFAILIYPAYLDAKEGLNQKIVPAAGTKTATFVLIADNDKPQWVASAGAYAKACQDNGQPQEFHLLAGGGHGFGLKDKLKPPASTWPDLLKKFLDGMK